MVVARPPTFDSPLCISSHSPLEVPASRLAERILRCHIHSLRSIHTSRHSICLRQSSKGPGFRGREPCASSRSSGMTQHLCLLTCHLPSVVLHSASPCPEHQQRRKVYFFRRRGTLGATEHAFLMHSHANPTSKIRTGARLFHCKSSDQGRLNLSLPQKGRARDRPFFGRLACGPPEARNHSQA